MPRLAWDSDALNDLDADSWQRKWDTQLEELKSSLAPKPAPAPTLSFDLKDWSPWNDDPAPAPAAPAPAPAASTLALDDPGWFPWREKPKPVPMPQTTSTPIDATITDGRTDPQPALAPGETVGSVSIATGPRGAGAPETLGQIIEGDPAGYFETAGPYARQVEREFGGRVPAALSLAISANETGYGQRRYMAGQNNYHGIQDTTGTGTPYVDWRPGPNGEEIKYEARQAGFADPLEGFRGFARFLTENPRYKPALDRYQQSGDVNQLAADIHAAGYAEDPAYTTKIQSIIRGIPVKTGVGEVVDS